MNLFNTALKTVLLSSERFVTHCFLCLRHDKLAGGGIMFSVVRQSVRWIVIVVKLMIETNKPIMMQIGTLSGSRSKGIKGQRCG